VYPLKLQKQTNRKVGAKVYDKYVVVIPPGIVQKAGWLNGITLHFKVIGDAVTISPSIIGDN